MPSPFQCERCGAVLPGNPSYAVEFPSGDVYHVCANCESDRPAGTTATAFDELTEEERDRLVEAVSGRSFQEALDDVFANPPHRK